MEYIKRISRFFEILPLLKGDILATLSKEQKDFEDSVLAEVAKVNMIPTLVTNNVKDYEGWPLLIVSPEQFLSIYK